MNKAASSIALAVAALVLSSCADAHHVPPASGPARPTFPPGTPARTGTPTPTTSPTSSTRAGSAPPSPSTISGSDWTTYQAGPSRLGVGPPEAALTPLRPAWSATLDGTPVYAQPLYAGGRVIVATEGDNVYALDPHDGSVDWRVHLGTPLSDVAAHAGCGDIDPLGITSTPVVDPATAVVYAVGEVSTNGSVPVHHQMVGIDILSGRVVLTENADPPLPSGEKAVSLLQREGLALGNNRIYIGYGGQYGDCGTYHGWLVSLSTTEATLRSAFDVTPSSTGGAIWGGGAAPAVASDGSVYVTTGNPNSGGPAPWAEAALKLAAPLGPVPAAVFRDRRASGDLDLATGTPVLLPGPAGEAGGTGGPGGAGAGPAEVFVTGKTDIGYRLRPGDLGELEVVNGTICASDPDGGAAFDVALDTLYVPCRDGGVQQIDLRGNATGWRAGTANSTPILAGGALWALSYPSGHLEELDPASGRVLYTTGVGRSVPNFASPSSAHGLLLVPTDSGIVAFSGPGGAPAS